jgi:integrase
MKTSNYAKTDARYWQVPGRLVKTNGMTAYGLRVMFRGRREFFSLHTPNRAAAAARAAEIYRALVAKGWEPTLAEYGSMQRVETAAIQTLGDFLDALAKTDLHKATREAYAKSSRRWAALSAGIAFDPSDPEPYLAKVREVPLACLTCDKLEGLIPSRIASAAKDGAMAENRARVSLSSMALQAAGAAKAVAKVTTLDPVPFVGLKVRGARSTPYRWPHPLPSSAMLAKAKADLEGSDWPAYAVIAIALGAGLRHAEIEHLPWCHVIPGERALVVAMTSTWRPKTSGSSRSVTVSKGLLDILEPHRGDPDSLVVAAGGVGRAVRWLRAYGIALRRPLHCLRGEFGSLALLASGGDLLSVSKQLGHANVLQTARSYTEVRRRYAPDLNAMLS